MSRVAIVGGGIAGLTIAWRLRETHDVAVFESESQAGGKVRSQTRDGYTFDCGPNGFLSNAAELRGLVRDAGLDGELVDAAPAAAQRFVYWNGNLHALPAKPQAALTMDLLSPLGKLRALADVFAKPPSSPDGGESIFAFAQRHFGPEVAQRIVAPALLGITGGDAQSTSLNALFPKLRAMEAEHGSLLRAFAKRGRGGAAPGRLTSFARGGFARLVERLAERLGERIVTQRGVTNIERSSGAWHVATVADKASFDALVITTPADVTAALLGPLDHQLATELRAIEYAPMRVVGVAYPRAALPEPPAGFGFLAARGEGLRILGALYTSTIFPQQAPPDTVFLRVFLGGAQDRQACSLSSEHVREVVLADIAKTLKVRGEPVAFFEASWPQAIPQYALDHVARVERVERLASAHETLFLAGNAFHGPGLADTVRDAVLTAERVSRVQPTQNGVTR